ncbi:MAG: hypothetical protein ACK553_12470 [Planctomycetota bacterium]|jgi:hypothetical protein
MTSDTRQSDPRTRFMWCFIGVAIAVRVGFWIATDRVWEDALITIRHAENAARGNGLTHHPLQGPPVHGFTSPISVLIPLAAECIQQGAALNVLRAVSLIAAALTIVVAYRIAIEPAVDLSPIATFFLLGFLAVEFHQVLFGMAGMETQCVVLINLFAFWRFLAGGATSLGVALSLVMWARPDGIVLVAVLLLGLLLQRRILHAVGVGALALLLFAPWILFTEMYFGSYVPHTIVAKKLTFFRTFSDAPDTWTYVNLWAAEIWRRINFLRLWFSPLYGGTGSVLNFVRGARPLQGLYLVIALVGFIDAVRKPALRVFPLYVFVFASYLVIMMIQPAWWYILPWLDIVAILFALGFDRIYEFVARKKPVRLLYAIPVGYVAVYAFATFCGTFAERHIQLGIENACRVRIGKWLQEHVPPDEWVACECLGYLGSYSNRPILDYPGLCSPRSVRAIAQIPERKRSLLALIDREKPEWLVLRPAEWAQLEREHPASWREYELVERFYADRDHIIAMGKWIFADGLDLTIDEEFVVLKRVPVGDQP